MKKKIITITGILLCGLLLGFVIGVTSCDSGFFGTLDELKTKAEGKAGIHIVYGDYSIDFAARLLPSTAGTSAQPITVTHVGGEDNGWKLNTDAAWLSFSFNLDGSGAGATLSGSGVSSTVYVTVSANNAAAPRTGHIYINGGAEAACTITQGTASGSGAAVYGIDPPSISLPNSASGTSPQPVSVIRINGSTGSWTLSTDATWLQFTINSTGLGASATVNGSGGSTTVYLALSENSAYTVRTAKIFINSGAEVACTVTQAAAKVPGLYVISPDIKSLPYTASGDSPQSVSVACVSGDNTDTWELSTDKTWLTFSANPDGSDDEATISGSGASTAVYLTVSANTGFGLRTAKIFINGGAVEACTVTQAADSGGYTIDPAAKQLPYQASGGSPQSVSVVHVSGNLGDTWMLTKNAAWLSFSLFSDGSNPAATKSGSGVITSLYLVVSENTGFEPRAATVYLNGSAACAVTQLAAPGVYTIAPNTFDPGSQSLPYTASNSSPQSISVDHVSGDLSDSWELSTDAAWLTLSKNSNGTNPGTTASGGGASTPVYLVVSENTTFGARTAIINLSGAVSCTVTQAAAPGVYKINPATMALSYKASGDLPQSVSVAHVSGDNTDTWSLSTNVTWLKFSRNENGSNPSTTESGSGNSTTIYLVVETNTGAARTAIISFNGASVCQVTQDDGTIGTETNPFIVYDAATLQKVGSNTNGWTLRACYRQTGDINMSGVDWKGSIGNITGFSGLYDGGNFSVNNLLINGDSYYCGLFGIIEGIVKDLKLVNYSIINNYAGSYTGGVAGIISRNGTVKNCSVTGVVTAPNGLTNVGGIVGINNYGTVQYCYTTVSVTCNYEGGGVVGINRGTVQYCYATGDVTNTYGGSCAGGVVGLNENMVHDCYATGNIIVPEISTYYASRGAGGVVGVNQYIVQNCYATGTVGVVGNNESNYIPAGGIVGYTRNTLKNCVALNSGLARLSGDSTHFGRVIGNFEYAISSNYARSDMAVPSGITVTPNAGDIHGADVSSGTGGTTTATYQYNNPLFWSETMGWNLTTVWEMTSGGLPVLRGMP